MEVEAGSAELRGRLDRHPVAFASALVVAVIVLQRLVRAVVRALVDGPHDGEAASLAADLVCSVAVIAILGSLGWWRKVGFTGPSHWRRPYLLLPLALVVGLKLLSTDVDLSDGTEAALELPQPFLTGFLEEGLVRGFLLFALLIAAQRASRGPWPAVAGSAALFGLLHFNNLLNGVDPATTVAQVLLAGFLGAGFAALLLRTNALWLIVLLHGLYNLPAALGDRGAQVGGFEGGALIFPPLFALYAVFLLRRAKDEDLPGTPQ